MNTQTLPSYYERKYANGGCMVTLLFIGMLISIAGCKTAQQLYDKAKDKDSAKVAENARKDFPCIPGKVKPSDSTLYKARQAEIDSIIYAYKIPDPVHDTFSHEDTANCEKLILRISDLAESLRKANGQISALNKAAAKPPVILRDTIPVRDMADSVYFAGEMKKKQAELDKSKAEGIAKDKKLKFWQGMFWVIVGIVAVCGIFIYSIVKKSLKQIK